MHPVNSAVQALVSMMEDCGISESPVLLTPDYDLSRCAYENGVPIKVVFGGRSAVFVADEIISATTRASFMNNARLNKVSQRAAAAGISMQLPAFYASRRLHACEKKRNMRHAGQNCPGRSRAKRSTAAATWPMHENLQGIVL